MVGLPAGMNQAQLAIGLDLGGTKILAALVHGRDGSVLCEARVPTPSGGGPPAILDALRAAASEMASAAADRPEPLAGIGIASAGHVDWETGTVVSGTPNIPGWAGTAVAHELQAATGLPVCCDNDGNAAAFGEAWVGAGRGCTTIVAVTLGTGFGAGIIERGIVLRGHRGGGGELGHVVLVPDGRPCNCGQQGCVEAYVSGWALGGQARTFWGAGADADAVFERARAGDARARVLLDEFARHLALILVTVFNIADPELVLIGGGIAAQSDLFLPVARDYLVRYLGGRRWGPDQVRLAQLGERSGVVGAAGQALERFGVAAPAKSVR